jgi:hypothetical protein
MSVGVMEDYKLRDLRASHTLGWSCNWNTKDKDEVNKPRKKRFFFIFVCFLIQKVVWFSRLHDHCCCC